ncbi:kinesin-associated protein 3 [Onthophagus taurus]|uniref:kinesin-associated protein 3 n=1 Tax=Onthophagus taurus TaxID=166361 RepID=UPI0039BDB9F6
MLLVIINVLTVVLSIILVVAYIIYISIKLLQRMDPEDAKFMRTDRKPGTLDVHPTLNALILNYDLEVQILGNNESVLYGEKMAMKKIIELPLLNSRTDCTALAKEVLSQCDLLHPSRLVEVEQTIYYLKKRKGSSSGNTKDADIANKNMANIDENANINCLNEYVELLYEGISDKVRASHLILILARDPENLESLSRNETFLSALARVLREDWKKSIVLSTNLIFIFFCFSTYSTFHHVVLHYKIGSLCMDIIDFELGRYDDWKSELDGGQKPQIDSPNVKRSCPNSASMTEIPRSRIPEPVRPKSGNFTEVNVKTTTVVMDGSVYEDLSNSTESIIDKKQLSEAEKIKRYRTLIRKQEQLLRVAFYLLLNIAEDENVEEKMTRKNIVGLLAKALDREHEELLIIVVSFLKKLSIMQANKDVMADLNVIEKLPRHLQSNNADLVHLSLKLLFNLSFDGDLRSKMIKIGLLPKLVSLLTDDRHQTIVLKLLYHLSYDEDVKVQFTYTDCISLITDMLLLSAGDDADQIIVALLINLATNPSNAQQMADSSRLHSLMTRAFAYQDSLLMKMIHNISEHDQIRSSFIEFVGDLAKAAVESKKDEFILESLGVLSNLHLPDLDWAEIFKHFDMVDWVKNILTSNAMEPDMILQVIILLGTAVHDEGCSLLLCKAELPLILIDLLKTHQEDDEIVLQIVYIFMIMLSHGDTVDYIINKTEAPAYLIDLLQDNNKAIRRVCNTCLNAIAECNATWADRIRIEKFRNHNAQWLQMVDSHQLEPEVDEDDNELPPYLNTEYLSTAVVPPLEDLANVHGIQDPEILMVKEMDYDYFEKSDEEGLENYGIEST